MNSVVRYTKHYVYVGYEIDADGGQRDCYLPVSRVKHCMRANVTFHGKPGMLYFEHWRKAQTNHTATALFGRPGFEIQGPVVVALAQEKWHCLRVDGTYRVVMRKLEHLSFRDAYAVVPTSGRDMLQDVIARDESDIALMKMLL